MGIGQIAGRRLGRGCRPAISAATVVDSDFGRHPLPDLDWTSSPREIATIAGTYGARPAARTSTATSTPALTVGCFSRKVSNSSSKWLYMLGSCHDYRMEGTPGQDGSKRSVFIERTGKK